MTQPPQPPGMGAQAAPLPPPPQPPIPPEYRVPPGPSAKKRPGWKVAAGALVTAAVFGLGFLAAQAIPRSGDDASTEAPTAASEPAPAVDSTTQTQQLCTAYAIARASKPSPQERALDVLPIATALRVALLDNPDADAEIRAAIGAVAQADDAWTATATRVTPQGHVRPPDYSLEELTAAYSRATALCRGG